MSKMWSCETLKVGFEDVMYEALVHDQGVLLTEIEDPNMLITHYTPS